MPDLNSVPPSPRVLHSTRHLSSSSTQMPPPPVPPVPTSPSSIHVFPSNQIAVSQGSAPPASSLPSPYFPPPTAMIAAGPPPLDGPGVGPGPGPMRHPRPLTAAELHMQLEKEQEAVVNRLTRELTLLRAQNASVVSNASSTSAGGGSDASAPPSSVAPAQDAHSILSGTTGFTIPSTTGRHSRTYSNASTRSQTAAAGSAPSVVGISSPAPIRPNATLPIRPSPSMSSVPMAAPGMSRQNSTASRRSRANSPGPSSLPHSYSQSYINDQAGSGYFQQHYMHGHRSGGGWGTPAASDMSPALVPGTSRYEEAAFYRAELESVKRENEALRRRVRELERSAAATAAAAASGSSTTPLSSSQQSHHHHQQREQREHRREHRMSDASRGRSESVSTTASTSGIPPAGSGSAAGPQSSLPTHSLASGAGITAPRDTGREGGRERVTSMLSTTGSVGVGVPEDELQVGESAATSAAAAQQGSEPAS